MWLKYWTTDCHLSFKGFYSGTARGFESFLFAFVSVSCQLKLTFGKLSAITVGHITDGRSFFYYKFLAVFKAHIISIFHIFGNKIVSQTHFTMVVDSWLRFSVIFGSYGSPLFPIKIYVNRWTSIRYRIW